MFVQHKLFLLRDLPLMFDMENYLCEDLPSWKCFVEMEASRIVSLSTCFTHLQRSALHPQYLECFQPLQSLPPAQGFIRRYAFLVRMGVDMAFDCASRRYTVREIDGKEYFIPRTFHPSVPFFPEHGLPHVNLLS